MLLSCYFFRKRKMSSDWVEIVDPQTQKPFYANVTSGTTLFR